MRVFAGLIAVAAALAGASSVGASPTVPPKPKLLIVLSMDQFALDLYNRYQPTFTGGLKRLSDGRVYTGYQSHAATETCPGHSTLLTGDHPARTGVVANNWYDRETGSNVYCVTARGVADPLAKTAALLKVDTLGDWMRAADPKVKVVSVSGKDRAAIMMAGHHPSAVFWWNDGEGFGTSKLAGPLDPVALKTARAFNQARFTAWSRKAPDLWPKAVPAACAALQAPRTFGQTTLDGQIPPATARHFPKGRALIADDGFAAELRASPAFDPMTLDFATALLKAKQLGRGAATDLLAVSLSTTDLIGHRYGSGGPEMCLQMGAVDAALQRFFKTVDALHVPYLVVLSADHGGSDAPERAGPPSTRVDTLDLTRQLNKKLRADFDLTYDPIAGDDPRQVIFALPPLDEPKREAIRAAAASWLKARPEVADVFTADAVAAAVPKAGVSPADLSMIERFHESFDRERSGELLVNFKERATLGVPTGPGANIAGHGSPWDYDRQVPVIFWWPGVAGNPTAGVAETVDIAPTLAAIAGVAPPSIDGRCLDLGQGCPH